MYDYTIHKDVQQKFVSAILQDMHLFFNELINRPSDASFLHQKRLKKLQSQFPLLKSHRSCFCCLMRMPEKVFDCGHSVCDICIKTFGTQSPSEKYSFVVSSCMLCGRDNSLSTFRYIPPTAGIRILCLDGGGIRGIISLAFVNYIDQQLQPFGCPFSDYFDYVCGTSAGK
jgi:hypothetical protein